jgi:hypothetical protein
VGIADQRPLPARGLPRVISAPLRELRNCWSFTWGDLTASVIPASAFTLSAWSHSGQPANKIPHILLSCLVYFWLYMYTFNLSNQLTGIEEDRINKPHRLLVTGAVSVDGARLRLLVTTVAFFSVGQLLGVFWWTVMWVAAWILHNHFGWARNSWGKNIVMAAGAIAQLAAAWQIVTPITPFAWTWLLTLALPVGFLISLQDLRDINGDRAVGRRTAVMAVSETRIRVFLSIAFLLYPVGIHFVLYSKSHYSPITLLFEIVTATICITIAYRVVRHCHRRADNLTYMLYTYWYCLTLVSSIFVLC